MKTLLTVLILAALMIGSVILVGGCQQRTGIAADWPTSRPRPPATTPTGIQATTAASGMAAMPPMPGNDHLSVAWSSQMNVRGICRKNSALS